MVNSASPVTHVQLKESRRQKNTQSEIEKKINAEKETKFNG